MDVNPVALGEMMDNNMDLQVRVACLVGGQEDYHARICSGGRTVAHFLSVAGLG